jgi:hypothetical protein
MSSLVKSKPSGEVYYNDVLKVYEKTFTPTLTDRLKYLSGLSPYPGEHFAHIAKRLQTVGVITPTIISTSRYSVKTLDVGGEDLLTKLLQADPNEIDFWLDQYTTAIAKTLQAGIFFADFHFRNYLVRDHDLYALDLDNYRDDMFSGWRIRRLIAQLDRQTVPFFTGKLIRRAERSADTACADRVRSAVSSEKICAQIRSKICPRRSAKCLKQ